MLGDHVMLNDPPLIIHDFPPFTALVCELITSFPAWASEKAKKINFSPSRTSGTTLPWFCRYRSWGREGSQFLPVFEDKQFWKAYQKQSYPSSLNSTIHWSSALMMCTWTHAHGDAVYRIDNIPGRRVGRAKEWTFVSEKCPTHDLTSS